MIIKFKIVDYDLENMIVTINWNDEITLAHTIPPYFNENTTNEELLEYAKTIVPAQELQERRALREKLSEYKPRLEALKDVEWEMDLSTIPPGANDTIPGELESNSELTY